MIEENWMFGLWVAVLFWYDNVFTNKLFTRNTFVIFGQWSFSFNQSTFELVNKWIGPWKPQVLRSQNNPCAFN